MEITPLKIGIVGAGFSGVSCAAYLHRLNKRPLEILLYEKSGHFGAGPAYSTPFHFHLLNVRAKDMSAFEEEPAHFLNWLHLRKQVDDTDKRICPEAFLPRSWYRQYLADILVDIQASGSKTTCHLVPNEITSINKSANKWIISSSKRADEVNAVVLALGNQPPAHFSFNIIGGLKRIDNSWDYHAVARIDTADDVVIIGSGLSMIDAVLTLSYQGHRGKIYVISRHGLLPLAHDNTSESYTLPGALPHHLPSLTKFLRNICQQHAVAGGDWRTVVNTLRPQIPALWKRLSDHDKRQFNRHLHAYWNIHRHRVHHEIDKRLKKLHAQGQLVLMAGRVIEIKNGIAAIKLRHSEQVQNIKLACLINCMGPSSFSQSRPLIAHLIKQGTAIMDPLNMGLAVTETGALISAAGAVTNRVYALGSLRKGTDFECSAVPEIRKQSADLARKILQD